MPANTPTGLPYPLPTEPVAEGAQAIRNLAEAVDARRIAEVALAASAAIIDFPGIPQTYRHLQLVGSLRTDQATTFGATYLRANGDAGANYIVQRLRVASATASALYAPGSLGALLEVGGSGIPAGVYCPLTVDIPNYRLGYPQFFYRSVFFPSGSAFHFETGYCLWQGAGAVTRLAFVPSAGNFASGSRVTLYGLP